MLLPCNWAVHSALTIRKRYFPMKKFNLALSILVIVLVVAQFVCMLLPYWNLTPAANRLLNPNPQPTDYSIMQYCWTDCREMNKIFENQFKKDYDVDYDGNDYVIGLVLTCVFGLLAAIFSITKIAKSFSPLKSTGTTFFCNAFSLAWIGYGVFNIFANFILTLVTYPMAYTLLLVATLIGAAVVLVRFALDVVMGIKAYRAEYCV